VDGHKLNHFTQGSIRKSKKDKEKEDEERKAREEEEKTAQVLAEFVDAFESEGPKKAKAGGGFVRAGAGPSYSLASRGGAAPPRGPVAMMQQEPASDCSPTPVCTLAHVMPRRVLHVQEANGLWTRSWTRSRGQCNSPATSSVFM
jgi:U2-associated protein SR140